jgi:leucyl/phenylalanyl-tRNA--protein transferase
VFEAYCALATMGVAHSIETWEGEALVGGVYGVAIGRMFFGESMFARRSDASKVALVHLVRQLRRWGFPLIDCQMSTSHLASLGARTIDRAEFLAVVRRYAMKPPVPAPWRLDDDLMRDGLGTMS